MDGYTYIYIKFSFSYVSTFMVVYIVIYNKIYRMLCQQAVPSTLYYSHGRKQNLSFVYEVWATTVCVFVAIDVDDWRHLSRHQPNPNLSGSFV